MSTISTLDHFNPLVRLPEFLSGVLTGHLFLSKNDLEASPSEPTRSQSFWLDSAKELVCLASIISIGFFFRHLRMEHWINNASWGSEFLGSWSRAVFPVFIFAITIYIIAKSKGLFSWMLSQRLTVFLGETSFAFYMIHFVVLRFVNLYSPSYGELSGIMIAACCFGISLALSIFLYLVIELPAKSALLKTFETSPKLLASNFASLSARKVIEWPILVAAVVAASSSYVLYANAQNQQLPSEATRIIQASLPEFRNVKFGSEIDLLGCVVEPGKQQTVLKMVWRKKVDQSRKRLIRILDAEAKSHWARATRRQRVCFCEKRHSIYR